MAANKTTENDASVDDFISRVEDPVKRADSRVLIELMSGISGAEPRMWGESIIGFGRCHYRYESGREGDMGILGFSPRKADLVIYLVDGTARYADRLESLGRHRTGKVCLYIKRLADVDLDVVADILRSSNEYVMVRGGELGRVDG